MQPGPGVGRKLKQNLSDERQPEVRPWTKPLPNDANSPLPVDVRRSKTLLLKLSIDLRE